MALTREFSQTVKSRAARDPLFRAAPLSEAVELLLDGELDSGKLVLRDYINVTIGFEQLAAETGIPAKSLMRMFSAAGNPRAENIFAVISQLKKAAGVSLQVVAGK